MAILLQPDLLVTILFILPLYITRDTTLGVAVMFFLLSKVDNPFPVYQENSLPLLQSILDAGRTVSGPLAVAELL